MSEKVAARQGIQFSIGGLWEYSTWELQFDVDISEYDGSKRCPHCCDVTIETHTRYDGSVYREKHWTCPRVIVQFNEGHHNSTGVCLDCVLAAVEALREVQT